MLRCGGRVERKRGGGINTTTIRQARDFCGGSKSDGDSDGDGNGKCHAPLSPNLAATALVLVAEAVATLITDDTDGGNSGVTILVGRSSLAAGGGLIIISIIYLLSTLQFLPLLGTNIVTHHGVSQSLLVIPICQTGIKINPRMHMGIAEIPVCIRVSHDMQSPYAHGD